MTDLQKMFHAEFTEPNQANLLRVLEAGLTSMETRLPTNFHRDGLAADDVCMAYMEHGKIEWPWLDETNPEFKRLYLQWAAANRKRIETVLSRS